MKKMKVEEVCMKSHPSKALTLLLSALSGLLLFSASLMAQTGQAPVATFHASGAFAQAFAFTSTSTGFGDVNLSVSRGSGGTPGSTVTFLNYNAFSYDFTNGTYTDTYAYGEIPNTALKGDASPHPSLNVDTSQVSGFQVTTCTYTYYPTFTFTCANGPFGLVAVDWQQNNQYSTSQNSNTKQTFFQFSMTQVSQSDYSSANSTGSLPGLSFSNGFGSVGTNHATTIQLYRVR